MDIATWLAESDNRRKLKDLIQAERLVEFGRIMLCYQSGRYTGLDIEQRLRLRPIPKKRTET